MEVQVIPKKATKHRSAVSARILDFSGRYRLRLVETGAEKVVPGRFGEIADMGDAERLRLRLLAMPRIRLMNKALLARTRRAITAGFTVKWKGDAEAILFFDPDDEQQASLAIELVRACRRRVLNLDEDRRRALAEHMKVVRKWGPIAVAA